MFKIVLVTTNAIIESMLVCNRHIFLWLFDLDSPINQIQLSIRCIFTFNRSVACIELSAQYATDLADFTTTRILIYWHIAL
jgi:hypothetical protein